MFYVLGLSVVNSKEKVYSQPTNHIEQNKIKSCDAYSIKEMEQAMISLLRGEVSKEGNKTAVHLTRCLIDRLDTYKPDINIVNFALFSDFVDPDQAGLTTQGIKQKLILNKLKKLKRNSNDHRKKELDILEKSFESLFARYNNLSKRVAREQKPQWVELLEEIIADNKKVNGGEIKHVHICSAYIDLANYYLRNQGVIKKAVDIYLDGMNKSNKDSKHGVGCYVRLGVQVIGVRDYAEDRVFSVEQQENILNSFNTFINAKNRLIFITDEMRMEAYAIKANFLVKNGKVHDSKRFLTKFDELSGKSQQAFNIYINKWIHFDSYLYAQIALGEVQKAFDYYIKNQYEGFKKGGESFAENRVLFRLSKSIMQKVYERFKQNNISSGYWIKNKKTRKNFSDLIYMHSFITERYANAYLKDQVHVFASVLTHQMSISLLKDNPTEFNQLKKSCVETGEMFKSRRALHACYYRILEIACRNSEFAAIKNLDYIYRQTLKYVDKKHEGAVKKEIDSYCKGLI